MLHKDITLATRMANKGLSPMDSLGSASQVAEKWRKWKRSQEDFPAPTFCWDGGPRQKICKILVPSLSQVTMLFKIAIRKLDSYFRAEENIPYERHVFRQLAPKEEETADQFMVSLKKTGATLRFWDEFKR